MEPTRARVQAFLQSEGWRGDAISPEMLVAWKLGEAIDELARVTAAASNSEDARARRREFAESRMLEKASGQIAGAIHSGDVLPWFVTWWRWFQDWRAYRAARKSFKRTLAKVQAEDARTE